MTLCFLGLGSNLRSPERQLRQAIHALRRLPSAQILAISRLYQSRPAGVRAQPNYYNLVLSMHTSIPARRLLRYCQMIENKHHRIRKKHWGPRTLDIDILLYGKIVINEHDFILPHPQLLKRDFVMVPLLEIAPTSQLPGGELLYSYLSDCHPYLFSKSHGTMT